MNIDFEGLTALVTGSTAGIGNAVATQLAESGARVIINGRSIERTEAAVAALKNRVPGAAVTGSAGDLSTLDGATRVIQKDPSVDILINNVGIFEPKPFPEISDDDWLRFFQTNVMSGVRLSRAYLPGMMERGWGRIIFVSSESALQVPAEMIHYGMTKTAQLAISRGLAELAANTGVTVNAVLPGPTLSDGVSEFLNQVSGDSGSLSSKVEAEFIAQHRPSSLIGRFATVGEVANLVVYTASRQASASTGAALRVDGGVVRSIA